MEQQEKGPAFIIFWCQLGERSLVRSDAESVVAYGRFIETGNAKEKAARAPLAAD
jgi:hypothetical protein